MKLSGVLVSAGTSLILALSARASDSGTGFDPTTRNARFAPVSTILPAVRQPGAETVFREPAREKDVTVPSSSTPDAQRAALDLTETRTKTVREKTIVRPAILTLPEAPSAGRRASISTKNSTVYPLVAKYQDRLAAATATNMARFPALGQATAAKINRFVFRRNPPEAATLSPAGRAASPAAETTPAPRR